MRGFLKPIAAVPLAMLTLAGMGGVAMAQQSADQIIAALKPSGNLVAGPTRGIKLGGAAAPQAQAPVQAARPVSAAPAAQAPRPQAARPAAPVAPPAADTSAGPSVNLTVNFPSGSADLTPTARASLDALGKALASSELASFRFRIEGHTDNVGSREENRALSQRRAEAVVSYLTTQYSVQPSRLEAVGMGQERPVVDTAPQTPEARNRRVQVINLGA
ncbi:MAG: OmpA family protein [Acetobacteraceae bacterium]|nr:OmpA family protein [Acetobacteraceae bacterium]